MSPKPQPDRRSGERGAAAVEFALVCPIILMLLIGMVELGRGYSAKISITAAAREGARAVALGDDGAAAARAAANDLDAGKLTVDAPASCVKGQPVTVTARYAFSYSVPLLPAKTVNLESRGVMRCGG